MDATHQPPAEPNRRASWSRLSLLLLVGLILAYVAIVGGPVRRPPGTEGPAIGRRVPFLHLEPLTGKATAVSLDDLQGRVTLVNFWGTWCPPCRRELPDIVALAPRFADRQAFRLCAVSCGSAGSDSDLIELGQATKRFLESKMITLPTYADPGAGSRRALLIALGLESEAFAYPTTIVFDQQGVIRGFWQGDDPRAAREMADLIEELLENPQG